MDKPRQGGHGGRGRGRGAGRRADGADGPPIAFQRTWTPGEIAERLTKRIAQIAVEDREKFDLTYPHADLWEYRALPALERQQYLANPHCRQVWAAFRDPVCLRRPMTAADRIWGDDTPRAKYTRRKSEWKTVDHWAARELALAHIEFLTQHHAPGRVVVYVGACPAAHVNLLVDLFPHLTLHLYDTAPCAGRPASNVVYHAERFDDATAERYAAGELRGRVLLISGLGAAAVESTAGDDALAAHARRRQHRAWLEVMRPAAALLRFRLPYAAGVTEDLAGNVFFSIWGGCTSADTWLCVAGAAGDAADKPLALQNYEHSVYEDVMFAFNTTVRTAMFDVPSAYLEAGLGYDSCFDCASELFVLENYCTGLAGFEAGSADLIAAVCRLSARLSQICSLSGRTLAAPGDIADEAFYCRRAELPPLWAAGRAAARRQHTIVTMQAYGRALGLSRATTAALADCADLSERVFVFVANRHLRQNAALYDAATPLADALAFYRDESCWSRRLPLGPERTARGAALALPAAAGDGATSDAASKDGATSSVGVHAGRERVVALIDFLVRHAAAGDWVVCAGGGLDESVLYGLALLFPTLAFSCYDARTASQPLAFAPGDERSTRSGEADRPTHRLALIAAPLDEAAAGRLRERADVLAVYDNAAWLALPDSKSEECSRALEEAMRWVRALDARASLVHCGAVPNGASVVADDVLAPVWAPPGAPVCWLEARRGAALRAWDGELVGRELASLHGKLRTGYYAHRLRSDRICHCFDCATEAHVCREYLLHWLVGRDTQHMPTALYYADATDECVVTMVERQLLLGLEVGWDVVPGPSVHGHLAGALQALADSPPALASEPPPPLAPSLKRARGDAESDSGSDGDRAAKRARRGDDPSAAMQV